MLVEYEYGRIGGPLRCQAGLTRWQAKICNATKRTTVLGLEWMRSAGGVRGGGGGGERRFMIGRWINKPPPSKNGFWWLLRALLSIKVVKLKIGRKGILIIQVPGFTFKMIHVSTTGGSKHVLRAYSAEEDNSYICLQCSQTNGGLRGFITGSC